MFPSDAIRREKLKQRRVSEILFEISALAQILGIDFRHWQAVLAKVPRKFKECGVLFAHAVENANGAESFVFQPYELSPGPAELALQRPDPRNWRVEMLFKKLLKNVDQDAKPSWEKNGPVPFPSAACSRTISPLQTFVHSAK